VIERDLIQVKLNPDLYKMVKARLAYDNLKTSILVKKVFEYYLNNDVDVAKIVLKIKEDLKLENKQRRTKTLKLIERGEKVKNEINLDKVEIQDLYDVLEMDDD
jgi:hypothetical protein|tara:strand:- start:981 stop:1292 length:312 start_codon:yes stop_codon:yes gene_type:complete